MGNLLMKLTSCPVKCLNYAKSKCKCWSQLTLQLLMYRVSVVIRKANKLGEKCHSYCNRDNPCYILLWNRVWEIGVTEEASNSDYKWTDSRDLECNYVWSRWPRSSLTQKCQDCDWCKTKLQAVQSCYALLG